MNRIKKIDILLIVVSIVVAIFLVKNNIPAEKYNYDESDYMHAISKGFLANYLDSPSIGFIEYIKLGLTKGSDKKSRGNLSEFIRKSGDIPIYRHYHGPLYYYYMVFMSYIVGSSEYWMRLSTFFLIIFGYILLYLGCLIVLEENFRIAAIVSSSLFLFSPLLLFTSTQITPHAMFLLATIINLLIFIKVMKSNDAGECRYYILISFIFVTISFIIIENAPFLLLTLLFCLFIKRKVWMINSVTMNLRFFIFYIFLLSLVTFFLLWPGGIIKLTILKNYLFHAYHTMTYSFSAKAVNGWRLLISLKKLFISYPFDVICITVSYIITLYLILWKKTEKYMLPLVIFTSLIIILILVNKSIKTNYISASIPAFYLMSGIIAAKLINVKHLRTLYIFLTVFFIGLFINNYNFYYNKKRVNVEEYHVSVVFLDYIDSLKLVRGTLLVPISTAPMINYYYPNIELFVYTPNDSVQQVVDRVRDNGCSGLLYFGNDYDKFKKTWLAGHFNDFSVIGLSPQQNKIVFFRKKGLPPG